jgi:hypothetical protein
MWAHCLALLMHDERECMKVCECTERGERLTDGQTHRPNLMRWQCPPRSSPTIHSTLCPHLRLLHHTRLDRMYSAVPVRAPSHRAAPCLGSLYLQLLLAQHKQTQGEAAPASPPHLRLLHLYRQLRSQLPLQAQIFPKRPRSMNGLTCSDPRRG